MRIIRIIVCCIGITGAYLVTADAQTPARQSGYQSMSVENKALQDDPSANPAFFWLMDGQTLWKESLGLKQKSCASCHGESAQSMKGVATHYPKVINGKLQTLEGQINQCRTFNQGLPQFAYESKELLALTAFVANQSKGLPIDVQKTANNQSDLKKGHDWFYQRMGQLNLSCAQCHEERAGLKLGGSIIPQAHPTGYPIYRIEWQSLGSLERRLRNCMSGVRAQPFEYGSTEMAQLELYLMWRARGMPLETPAVRP
ncbi:sulfur oxidation c-type cytochrome SoxA [Polynucleobacter paludilacus]|uniref:sulfur oxidation c-type cytochrome SoxA n=1 Tax=Polynucleobacter paludilacus TaxID=1855895 RepID=UPI002108F538|nr:sulfur oxidation c-type cytochrome SoxA [Polynucleobacter paludilacus]